MHDLPHASSTTEWWYLNAHLTLDDGRAVSVFAAFFRIVDRRHPDGRIDYAHSLTWAVTDVATGRYLGHSFVDAQAPRMGLERIQRGGGSKDARLNRAISEVLERGRVPRPDRIIPGAVEVDTQSLALKFGGCTLLKQDDGAYALHLRGDDGLDVALRFTPQKPPIRHGEDGVVRGVHGEDMFYYFVPRCRVEGELALDGVRNRARGDGWYDHEFGCPPPADPQAKARTQQGAGVVAWNWVSAQLDDGTDVNVYDLVRTDTRTSAGRWAIVSDAQGRRYAFDDFTLEPRGQWRSVRTFESYPTAFSLRVPEAQLELEVEVAFADQELVTVLSRPGFWEGRCNVQGTLRGEPVSGLAYLERSGFYEIDSLDDFFKRVGEEVRASVRRVYPLELTAGHANQLVGAEGREGVLDGVHLPQLARTLLGPVREITDRGGKAWRSYAALACCDVVLGDSRRFAEWLAMPELFHVGSLIVDDVEDRSTVRRGGPAAHVLFGEALALNAGTAAYFLGERLLRQSKVTDAQKLQLYDLYFEALREGHAGQALDLDGLDAFVPDAVETGDAQVLESRVLAIHRLKTAAPAAALARMGAVAGGGSAEQVEALGRYFGAVGTAFQIVDDVLNLRGFKGDLKQKGEDLTQGKVTLPVARAFGRLDPAGRRELWRIVSSKPADPTVVASAIALIEGCGALDDCQTEARTLVERAWAELDPIVEESLPKVMLRAFGWYVLERHY